jgi:DNA polymerase-3 subunit alpha
MVVDFVCEKFVKTKRGDLMKFRTFLDAEGRFFWYRPFPQSSAKYPLRGAGIYLVEGKVILECCCPSIEVIRCVKMPLKPDPRSE